MWVKVQILQSKGRGGEGMEALAQEGMWVFTNDDLRCVSGMTTQCTILREWIYNIEGAILQ